MNNCTQCGEEMAGGSVFRVMMGKPGEWKPLCINRECKNYNLLQATDTEDTVTD